MATPSTATAILRRRRRLPILLYQPAPIPSSATTPLAAATGSDYGVALTGAGATGISITQNTIECSLLAGIDITGDAGGATISQNVIANNAAGIVIEAAATNVAPSKPTASRATAVAAW